MLFLPVHCMDVKYPPIRTSRATYEDLVQPGQAQCDTYCMMLIVLQALMQ